MVRSAAATALVSDCRFEELASYGAIVAPDGGHLFVQGCLFAGIDGVGIGEFVAPVGRTRREAYGGGTIVSALGNTFARVEGGALSPPGGVLVQEFSRNVVTGGNIGVVLSFVDIGGLSAFMCNDVWGNETDWAGGPNLAGQFGNFSLPPLYCDPGGNDFSVSQNSPCLPENNACGALVGAFGQGCGVTSVEPMSWARAKAMFR